ASPADEAGRACARATNRSAALSSVGTGRSARLASAARSFVRIAAAYRGVLGVRTGITAGGEREAPASPLIAADKGRERDALLSGNADDLATATAEARALLGDTRLGFCL